MGETGSGDKLKVFISYSRRDSTDFADELVAGLELAGFDPVIDRHDIAAGEKWEDRLGGLIDQADTVVFVVSPEAVKSERCAWEVERTLQKSKRLLPVVFKSVPEAAIPEGLRERQFVRFDTGPGITRPLAQLAEALRRDLDWIREHTRIGDLAARWEARGRPQSLLLRGEDIGAAQAWVERRKPDAPAITEVVRAFIKASKEAEATQLAKTGAIQRRIILMQAAASVLLVGIIIVLVGWINQGRINDTYRLYWVEARFAGANMRPLTPDAEKALRPDPEQHFRECIGDANTDICPEMVVVPAGSFDMGSPETDRGAVPNEFPQHPVTIARPFAVAKYPLTFSEWDTCVAYGDCVQRSAGVGLDAGWGRKRLPAIYVNWPNVHTYVAWLSRVTGKRYRLLTEAEYEYATRAGTTTLFPWGDDIGKNNANCNGCSSQWDNKQTAPVGSFAANKFGLYDMVGNVWEWVEDCYHPDYSGDPPKDGSAWSAADCSIRVARGGAFTSPPRNLRSARRGDTDGNDIRGKDLGFRVARTLDTR